MKHTAIITALAMLALTACDKKPSEEPFVPTPVFSDRAFLPTGHPPVNNNEQPNSIAPEAVQMEQATVVSTIDIPQFTYLEVSQNNRTRWIAASTIAVKKGDAIEFDNGTTIVGFNSKILNRDFPDMTFVNHVSIDKGK